MAKTTGISWTDSTWNPWMGCHKVSAGCKNCYMFRDMVRYGRDPNVVKQAAPSTFDNPIKWANKGELKAGSRIFTCSWSDWFVEEADPWRGEAWKIIRKTPQYDYLILTKRVENIVDRLPEDWGSGWPNVWLGASTENQLWYDKRIRDFVSVPAALHFLSIEPMLGPVDLSWALYKCPECGVRANNPNEATLDIGVEFPSWKHNGSRWEHYHGDQVGYIETVPDPLIDWAITGGESDRTNSRMMQLQWATDVKDQCANAGISFFHKQMGTRYASMFQYRSWKGDDLNEWPASIRIQQNSNKEKAMSIRDIALQARNIAEEANRALIRQKNQQDYLFVRETIAGMCNIENPDDVVIEPSGMNDLFIIEGVWFRVAHYRTYNYFAVGNDDEVDTPTLFAQIRCPQCNGVSHNVMIHDIVDLANVFSYNGMLSEPCSSCQRQLRHDEELSLSRWQKFLRWFQSN